MLRQLGSSEDAGEDAEGRKLNEVESTADYVVLATGSSYVSPIEAASDKPAAWRTEEVIMAAHSCFGAECAHRQRGNRRRRVGC